MCSRMPGRCNFADTDVPDDEEAWIERNESESVDAEIATGDTPVLGDYSLKDNIS